MKRTLLHILTVLSAIAFLQACSVKDAFPDNGPTYYPDSSYYSSNYGGYDAGPDGSYTSVVTVKKDEEGKVYLLLAGELRLYPYGTVPYEHQYRAMTSVRQAAQPENGRAPVTVQWLEPIDDGIFTTDTSVQGADGIDLNTKSWITTSDDGYLTLHYSTQWGRHPVHHDFYLVAGTVPSEPYTLELRHNANGDLQEEEGEGIINFDINTLPDTGESTRIIHLKWINTRGEAEAADFGFKTRK
ncbi:MAG: hypothetical protein J5640_03410 [Bacteroidales bacterium]|nr:hypothetical protein [Bacteroidales bacterium]